MGPELQAQFAEFVKLIIDAAQSGAAWTAAQAPTLVQEWLQWIFYAAILKTTLATLFLIVPGILLIIWVTKQDFLDDGEAFATFLGIILFVIGGMIAVPNTFTAIKVKTAPRVVVVERFIELVRPSRD